MNVGSDDMDAPMTTGCMNIGGGRNIPYQKVDGCMNYRKSIRRPYRYPHMLHFPRLVLSHFTNLTSLVYRISRRMHELQIEWRLHELRV